MSEPAEELEGRVEPEYERLITEDGAAVESVFQEKQMRLLVDTLHTSWNPGRPFVAFSDVGLFGSDDEEAVAPDVLVSLDVRIPPGNPLDKKNRSYFVWRYGKSPDVVVEIVSNRQGGEEQKMARYASLAVSYVVIYDPELYLTNRALRAYELHGRHYVDLVSSWLPDAGLGITTWDGEYEGMRTIWLRWCGADGQLLPAPLEALEVERERVEVERERAEAERQRAEAERQRAEAERQRAEAERQRAEAERQRADRLAERLRALGADDV
ncbi:MAG: Uma2 family endonuclease [Candidatus Xenobia bacterium]